MLDLLDLNIADKSKLSTTSIQVFRSVRVMWRSRLFWKIFTPAAFLIVTATSVFSLLMSAHESNQANAYFRDRLRDDAVLMKSMVIDSLASETHDGLQETVARLARETNTRMTV